MDTVYLETTVVGHIAGRLHPDPLIAARQQFARSWWAGVSAKYRVFISQLVIDECSGGDAEAARERLNVVEQLELLEVNDEVEQLANKLTAAGAIPPSEPRDALHLAVAAFHGIQYLVSWNFRHIVNAAMRTRIESVFRQAGVEPPIICTPEELAGDENNEISH